MRYKTTIEIVTEAADKNEAMEVAGEYLAGNIVSGVEMKYATRPLFDYRRKLCFTITIFLVSAIGIFTALCFNTPQRLIQRISGINAIQPPLKTSAEENKRANFKEEWRAKQAKEALVSIRK